MEKLYKIFIIVISCFNYSYAVGNEYTYFNAGDGTLKIPVKYLLGPLPKSLIGTNEGMDLQQGLNLKIPASEFGLTATGEGRLQDSFIIFLNNDNGNVSPAIRNAWEGNGLYKTRIVEFDETRSLYRVYPKSGHPKLWEFFSSKPNHASLENQHVSTCSVSPFEEEKSDLSNATCKLRIRKNSLVAELSMSGIRLRERQLVEDGTKKLFDLWRKNADKSHNKKL